MRPEWLYLQDIVEAADAIERFLEGIDEPEFLGNDLIRSAVLQKLTVIGEAAARLSEEFGDSHPQVPWRTAELLEILRSQNPDPTFFEDLEGMRGNLVALRDP